MNIMDQLDQLLKKARRNPELRNRILDTQIAGDPLREFCRICTEEGYEIYPMDLINEGEAFYAAMRRSTNGGGENSPMLEGEDDMYELFLAALR